MNTLKATKVTNSFRLIQGLTISNIYAVCNYMFKHLLKSPAASKLLLCVIFNTSLSDNIINKLQYFF